MNRERPTEPEKVDRPGHSETRERSPDSINPSAVEVGSSSPLSPESLGFDDPRQSPEHRRGGRRRSFPHSHGTEGINYVD